MLAAAYPISASEPVGDGGRGRRDWRSLAAPVIWLIGSRIPLLGFELIAAAGSLCTPAAWWRSRATHGGMMITAFGYPWIAIYAAHFFPRRGVIVQGVLISVGFSAGLLVGGLSHILVYWAVVIVTIWSICLLLGPSARTCAARRAPTT